VARLWRSWFGAQLGTPAFLQALAMARAYERGEYRESVARFLRGLGFRFACDGVIGDLLPDRFLALRAASAFRGQKQ
jgi:hypothetical protein